MALKEYKNTRLGDLLLDKKLISEAQLEEAITVQRRTHQQLGDILVEMKLVSRWQVWKLLKLQRHLRNTLLTSILSVSPLMLVGCGGGGGAGASGSPSGSASSSSAQQQVEAGQASKQASRSAKLSWTLPSVRADGSDLELYEIETFRIYHTTDDGAVEEILEVPGDETELDLSELKAGTHLFAVTVVDSNGLESDFSDTVTKTIL